MGVHDPGPGLQGNHHWLVLHQCLHLHQQLCSKCKEGKPGALVHFMHTAHALSCHLALKTLVVPVLLMKPTAKERYLDGTALHGTMQH